MRLWRCIAVGFARKAGPRGPTGAGGMGTYTWIIIFPSCVTARWSLKTPCIVVGFTMSAASFGQSFQEQQESLFPALIAWIRVNRGVRVAPRRLDNGVFGLIFEWGDCPRVASAKGQRVCGAPCAWSRRTALQTCPCSASPSAVNGCEILVPVGPANYGIKCLLCLSMQQDSPIFRK